MSFENIVTNLTFLFHYTSIAICCVFFEFIPISPLALAWFFMLHHYPDMSNMYMILILTVLARPDGTAGTENATGDTQKKLDVLSNEMFVNSLYNSHACAILVSEENDEPIIVPPHMAGT